MPIFSEQITVTTKPGKLPSFVWRDQNYQVKQIIDHWRAASKCKTTGEVLYRNYYRVKAGPVLKFKRTGPARTMVIYQSEDGWMLSEVRG